MSSDEEMIGKQFGEWTVLAYSKSDKEGRYYRCRCSCGTERVVLGRNLTKGFSKSCGCTKIIYQDRILEAFKEKGELTALEIANILNPPYHQEGMRKRRAIEYLYCGFIKKGLVEKVPDSNPTKWRLKE